MRYRTVSYQKESDLLKALRAAYIYIRYNEGIDYDHRTRGRVRYLQEQLQTESLRLSTEHWEKKIGNMNIKYGDQQKFWRDVRLLQGCNKTRPKYILNDNNEKLYEPEEKLECFNP